MLALLGPIHGREMQDIEKRLQGIKNAIQFEILVDLRSKNKLQDTSISQNLAILEEAALPETQ